jgi:hypothetical protein
VVGRKATGRDVLADFHNALTLTELLDRYRRIAVTGGPNSGKTTGVAARVTDRTVIHTDDWKHLGYSPEVPFLIIDACKAHSSFLVEGVQAARALRKGLEVDAAVWMLSPLLDLTPEQERQRRGTQTIWADVLANFLPADVKVFIGAFDGEEPRFE